MRNECSTPLSPGACFTLAGMAAGFLKIARLSEMPAAGEAREFKLMGRTICIANVAGEFSALANECPHRGGPLGQGVLDGDTLICPWHGWQFNAKSGAVVHSPEEKITTFELRIEGDEVFVEDVS